jgi:hypothetical protein
MSNQERQDLIQRLLKAYIETGRIAFLQQANKLQGKRG